MIQQHNLLIRPPHLVHPMPASVPRSLPKRPSTEISPGLLFTESRVFCQQDRSCFCSWCLGFLPLLEGVSPILGHGNYLSITPLRWSVLHRRVIPPSPEPSEQAEGGISPGLWVSCWLTAAVLGMMDAQTQLNSTALWHHELGFHCAGYLILSLPEFLLKFCETLILVQNQGNFALPSYKS